MEVAENRDMLKIVACLIGAAALVSAQPASIEGLWQGTLNVGAVKLRLALHISRDGNGALAVKMDSIDQGGSLNASAASFANPAFHFESPKGMIKYDGTMNAEGTEIAGTFTQSATMPLVFKRVEKLDTLARPQMPKPPFPYRAEDVEYENKTGGVKLAGTLTIPQGSGQFPVALMITGSGPQDRDETLMGHKPFLVIADYLSRRGIAVLRVDDRGMGKSTGRDADATIDDMVGDVLTGVTFLKGRAEIDPHHIGVIGHSLGGIVGPLAASRSQDISFVVMLAGTGVTGMETMYRQSAAIIRASGGTDAMVAANRKVQELMFTIVRAEQDPKVAADKLREALKQSSPGISDGAIDQQIATTNSPNIRSFLVYDPAPTLAKLRVPVLAMNGSRDVQVIPEQNLPAIVKALSEGGDPDFEAVELTGLNHLFQTCKTCIPAEYPEIEETFSPAALATMGEWLERHLKR